MATRLIADVRDDRCGFALYDPAAFHDGGPTDGGAATHRAMAGKHTEFDIPGTERRIAWVCVDEDPPDALTGRAEVVVRDARLDVPSGKLIAARRAREAMAFPTLIYRLSSCAPGSQPATSTEER